jgi:DNA polymerase-3 subunit gamma/tau
VEGGPDTVEKEAGDAEHGERPPAPVRSLLAAGTPNAAPATPTAVPPADAHPDAGSTPPGGAGSPTARDASRDRVEQAAPGPARAPTPTGGGRTEAPTAPTERPAPAAASPALAPAAASPTGPAPAPATPAAPVPAPATTSTSATPVPAPATIPGPAGTGPETEVLRRRWPEVLDTLSRLKKVTWVMVSQNAQVGELTPTSLTLLFPGPGLATAFRGGPHAEVVQRAVRETLGFDVRVEGRVGDGAGAPGSAASRPLAAAPSDGPRGARAAGPVAPDRVVDRASAEASWATVEPPDDDIPEGPAVDVVPPDLETPRERTSARAAGERAHAESMRRTVASGPTVEDSPSPDDPDIASSHLTGPPLVAQMLGGTVIDEQLGDEI